MGNIQIEPFDLESFRALIAGLFSELLNEGEDDEIPLGYCADTVGSSRRVKYFESYFSQYKRPPTHVIIEHDYIDKDYIIDYSMYYARCFRKYRRHCARLHFVSGSDLTQDNLEKILSENGTEKINRIFEEYYGFIVLKPLPKTFFGRTCLKPWQETVEGEEIFMPCLRRYNTHLFGTIFTVDPALAFQEQDSEVGACASSAIWSMLHGTARLFGHATPSPGEITENASEFNYQDYRTFPNSGLYPEQMIQAVKEIGLDPWYIRVEDQFILQDIVYSYVSFGLPLVLSMELIDMSENEPKTIGYHAVTIVGYKLGKEQRFFSEENPDLVSQASFISELFVNDDGVGPYASMKHVGSWVDDYNEDSDLWRKKSALYSTEWENDNRISGCVYARPYGLLVPLYHKIRLTHDHLFKAIVRNDEELRKDVGAINNKIIKWELRLIDVHELKKNIIEEGALKPSTRKNILIMSRPKYLWGIRLSVNNQITHDIIFDATDIGQGFHPKHIISYDDKAFISDNE